jgi:medium-chain acyl-[acyl-carrier-protein] hydrolase
MTDAEIVAMLRGLGGTPESFLRDPTVLRMILPPFRADFAVRDGYRYHQRPPLTVPVTAIAAAADPRVDTASMAGWREVTTGRFRAHTVPGGHFAVLENSATTLALISSALGG